MRLSSKNSSGTENDLRYKLVIIETFIFVLPVLAVGYIFWKSNIVLELSHVIIILLILILVLVSMILIRQIFDKIIHITTSIKMAHTNAAQLIDVEQETSELHEITVSFNNLLLRLENTSDELKRRTFELLTIKELVESVGKNLEIGKIFELLLKKSMIISGAQIGSVFIVESEKMRFRVAAFKGREPGPQENAYIQFSSSIVGQVFSEKKSLIVKDIEKDPRTARPNDSRYKSPSFLSMPISAKGDLVAILNLADKENLKSFDSEDEQILSVMIAEIGFAIENAMLHSDIKEHAKTIAEHASELTIANRQLQEEINERKRIEEELQHVNKMKAIGALAGGISHEFNNLLAIILGNAELAANNIGKNHPAIEQLEAIEETVQRGTEVVNQIFRFARKSDISKRPMRLTPAIGEALKLMRASLPATLEVQTHFSCESDTVMADSTQVNEVLINLCTNARDAMKDKGGILEIKLENQLLDEQSIVKAEELAAGNYVRLVVSDNGSGIDPSVLSRIFEPYFTTKNLAEGTGMGLSVVHGIIKNHNGAIRVHSEPGQGTRVEIFFPCVETETSKPPFSETKELPTGNEHILFVDDEIAIVKTYTDILKRLGYNVVSSTSPVQTLEIFKNQPDQFDLVITDMTMPEMTGTELVRELKKIRSDIRLILCTGYSDQIDEQDTTEKGIDKIAIKPFGAKALASIIRDVLDEL